MRDARNFLLAANEAFPPPEGTRHALTVNEEGNLEFSISVVGGFWPVHFDDDDLDRDINSVLQEIKGHWIEAARKRTEEGKKAEEENASADADGS
jgi:hypothetical protein